MTKPWPNDAVIIVAARAGTEVRSEMEAVLEAACRDCGTALHACTRTKRQADARAAELARPVAYLCPEDAVTYDARSITELHGAERFAR